MRPTSQREVHAPAVPSASSAPQDSKRRRLLFALGAGGAATVAAATHAVAAPVAGAVAEAPANAKQGYRETDHVRTYYASTRI